MITKTRIVANFVVRKNNRGTVIFNDCIGPNIRSLKVWNWTKDDYLEAKNLLESMNCKVTIKRTAWGRTRLWVEE